MVGAILTFIFLYGLIYFFERDRDDLDGFTIATAVVVPTIIMIFVQIGAGLLGLGQWAGLISLAALVVATYLVLAIHLEIKRGHAIAYTAAVVVFNILLGVGLVFLAGAG